MIRISSLLFRTEFFQNREGAGRGGGGGGRGGRGAMRCVDTSLKDLLGRFQLVLLAFLLSSFFNAFCFLASRYLHRQPNINHSVYMTRCQLRKN